MKWSRLFSVISLAAFVTAGSIAAFAEQTKVVLMWVGKAGMPKRVSTGFIQKMKQIAPNVEIIQYRELKDTEEATRIFKQAEATANGIVFLRSSGAEFLGKLEGNLKVPCFVGACNNPQDLGTVKNLDAPEGMVTGVTYHVPYAKRFDTMLGLFPNVKSVALFLEKGHPASSIDREGTKLECAKRRIAYHEVTASNLDQVRDGAKQLGGKVDLFIMGSVGLVLDNLSTLLAIANQHKTPIFSYAADRAEKGATAELAANDDELGQMLAESVVDVVVNKKPISKVPVKLDPNPDLVINEAMINSLGIKVPEALMSRARLVK